VIVSENAKYAGIFSENDYARKMALLDRQPQNTLVKEVMTTDLPMVNGSDKAERCMKLMNMHKTRYLPVFDDFEFRGVITIHDLMRETIADSENKRDNIQSINA
jgi:CBS domain-containing protein